MKMCPQGHVYTEANTYLERGRWRRCRACLRDRHRAYQQANPELRRGYREKYRDLMRPYHQAYAKAHPDFVAIRRARKVGATVERVYRAVVFRRDDGRCGECGIAVDPQNWHLDHVIPLARGGEHSYANTQVTHPLCNLRKGVRAA